MTFGAAGELRYFAYGSNLLPERLQRRCRSACVLTTGVLKGYSLEFNKQSPDGSGKCTILPCSADQVWGALYQLSAADKQVLDRIEGLGFGYQTLSVNVDTTAGIQTAFTYIAMPAYCESKLKPYDWYQALVLEGAIWHRLPSEYIRRIRDIESAIDPNRARGEENFAIVEAGKQHAAARPS